MPSLPPAGPGPSPRPRSLQELKDQSKVTRPSDAPNYLVWCRSVARLFEEGHVHRSSGDIEEAYLKFFRGLIIVLDIIPKLPSFHRQNHEYLKLRKLAEIIFPVVENLAAEITIRYKAWESMQSTMHATSSAVLPPAAQAAHLPTRRASKDQLAKDLPPPYEATAAGLPPQTPSSKGLDIASRDSMSPNDLARFLSKAGAEESPTVLVLDVRPVAEFLVGHIRWTKRQRPDGRPCGGVVNIDPTWLRPGMPSKDIEQCLQLLPGNYNTLIPKQLFSRRHEFDLIVYMDARSSSRSESQYFEIIDSAIYSFEADKTPRYIPKIIVGGFEEWVRVLEIKNGSKEQWIEQGPGWGGEELEGLHTPQLVNGDRSIVSSNDSVPQRPLKNPSRRGPDISSSDDLAIVRSPYEYIQARAPPTPSVSVRASNEPTAPQRSPSRRSTLFDSPNYSVQVLASIAPYGHSSSGLNNENQLQREPSVYQENAMRSWSIQTGNTPASTFSYPGLPQSKPPPTQLLPDSPMKAEAPPLPSKPPSAYAKNNDEMLPAQYEAQPYPTRSALPPRAASPSASPLTSRFYVPQGPAEEMKWESSSSFASAGLKNLGNTCFMNSVIQCLSGTLPLATFFNGGKYRKHMNRENTLGTKGHVTDQFATLIRTLWSQEEMVVAPTKFKETVGTYAPQFRGNEQQDAQEFLAFLLDALHEDLNDARSRRRLQPVDNDDDTELLPDDVASSRSWHRYQQLNKSYIVDLFQGQLRSRLECLTCHKTSTTFDSIMYLSLPIPTAKRNAHLSLDDCLAKFHEEEVLQGSDAWRFYFQGHFRNKIETVVDFPLRDLDLARSIPRIQTRSDQPVYNLYAVANHFGGLNGGHYTAMVRNGYRGEWYSFDDARVSRCDSRVVKSKAAYILFYVNKNIT
ncbi:hypothetical protein SeMB42_g04876 [Synchytrium endobioticum]|uniref:Ubiquitin carboxyl-terminal hydrolase n=1 Tax=Synchytrium endobioticum TaxID=286115 RepID=A0A507CV55_9FUNG|nr:hypothetical protein SeMB42_g04876 [Synchytrium endobioticum]